MRESKTSVNWLSTVAVLGMLAVTINRSPGCAQYRAKEAAKRTQAAIDEAQKTRRLIQSCKKILRDSGSVLTDPELENGCATLDARAILDLAEDFNKQRLEADRREAEIDRQSREDLRHLQYTIQLEMLRHQQEETNRLLEEQLDRQRRGR